MRVATKKETIEYAEKDIVVVVAHWYPCLDGQYRAGAGGRYLVKVKFRNGSFFGEPLDGVGYAHVVPAEHIRWRMDE